MTEHTAASSAASADGHPHDPGALFQQQASSYSTYRPAYSQQIYDIILAHLPDPQQRQLAVDVATGNGQAAVQLAQFFQQVLATDASADQLSHARQAPNVTYAQRDAHTIDAADGSVDLVTAASSLHWFDTQRFYREARRVLRPHHGCLAAWAIPLGLAQLEVRGAPGAEPACQAALHHIYEGTLGECWDERKRHADNMYRGIHPSLQDFDLVLLRELSMPAELTVEQMAGYISSWSAYNIYRRRHPAEPDPLIEFQMKLRAALEAHGLSCADATIVAHIPTVFLLAQGPKPVS